MKWLIICIGLLCSCFVNSVLQRTSSFPLVFPPHGRTAATPSDPPNFDSLYTEDIQSLPSNGEKMQAYLRDGEKIRLVVQILEKELGYTELDERRVIDISYPSLMAYVRRLKDSGKYPQNVFQNIENIDQSSGEDLCRTAKELLFDLSELSSGSTKRFTENLWFKSRLERGFSQSI